MKKLLTLLLTLLMVFTLVGCNSTKEEEPVVVDTPQINEPVQEEIVGGFVDVEDRTLTDELKQIFNKALEGYVGMSLQPVELYQTQVVAGTNYKFVCSGTKTTNPPITGTYFVTVYQDLEGNCSITEIETVTENSGDVDGDPSQYKYWVVFYNPDGNELYRTAIKYGAVPEYKGETPNYWDSEYCYKFVCWTDKQGNEIKEFKPITGNTYIYAKYEIGGEHKKVEAAPTPSPEPSPILCSDINDLYYIYTAPFTGIGGDWGESHIYKYADGAFSYYMTDVCATFEKQASGATVEQYHWYHNIYGGNPVECIDPNHHGITTPPAHVCTKASPYLLYINDVQSSATVYVYQWNSSSNCYDYLETKTDMDTSKFSPQLKTDDIGKYYHTDDKDNPGQGNQQLCDDYEAHVITCFVAGTQVQYDLLGNTKNIEDFKVGDQIVSYNVNTNKYYLAKVGNVFVHDGNEKVSTLADVILEDGSIITMTPNHPVLTTAGFRAIDNDNKPKLQAGQFVMTNNGWTRIKEINVYNCDPTTTYNLGIIDYDEIVDNDTYDTYVAGGIVVHNIY